MHNVINNSNVIILIFLYYYKENLIITSMNGAINLQGPHHLAKKSMMTNFSLASVNLVARSACKIQIINIISFNKKKVYIYKILIIVDMY